MGPVGAYWPALPSYHGDLQVIEITRSQNWPVAIEYWELRVRLAAVIEDDDAK